MPSYIHIYYGEGKGKTTAAIGLAIRAIGAGKQVLLARFLKTNSSSEINALKQLPNITIIPTNTVFGYYYTLSSEEKKSAYAYYQKLLVDTCTLAYEGHYDLLILDELTYAYCYEFIDLDYLLQFLKNRPTQLEIVITGKHPSPELLNLADYASEIKKIRHPYDKGVLPREGIEL
ncbi:cob(I)yrinic acid a,c-diamide adenosyltransferase [Anaerosporobacter faecicola]|uniref:cob(I)yrinic acid a,c-diamide adenosyltransferase n=1 Tax=Anaerosporobacter faecicola TaxID=2718714 RepID=UPI0014388894|nr:cob(I)yrinic acid a,c-diamide adenosyltransferase [Anaerosporobacter faecicola]